MVKCFAWLLSGALLLTGCAAPPPPAATAPQPTAATVGPSVRVLLGATAPSSPGGDTANNYISITPLTTVPATFNSVTRDRFSDAYTRLAVDAAVLPGGAGGTAGALPYTTRTILARFLFGEHTSLNLMAKVAVGPFGATVPLLTLDQVTNSTAGEAFTRLVSHQAQNFPFFLIRRDGGNAVVSVQFSVKANDSVTSAAAGTMLSMAQNVAQFVSPESAVVTTLTQQSTKDVAATIDKAIGRLFTTSIDEEHLLDQDIGRWPPGGGATVALNIPGAEGDWSSASADKPVGTWTIRFAAPKPSIFSDITICDTGVPTAGVSCRANYVTAATDAERTVSPDEVLSFQLINGAQSLGMVATYLKQKDWYTAALSGFATTGGVSTGSVGQFGRSIKSSITDLNLNAVDAGIVTSAVRRGLALQTSVTDQMNTTHECALLYPITS
jgi:hypothetical protein